MTSPTSPILIERFCITNERCHGIWLRPTLPCSPPLATLLSVVTFSLHSRNHLLSSLLSAGPAPPPSSAAGATRCVPSAVTWGRVGAPHPRPPKWTSRRAGRAGAPPNGKTGGARGRAGAPAWQVGRRGGRAWPARWPSQAAARGRAGARAPPLPQDRHPNRTGPRRPQDVQDKAGAGRAQGRLEQGARRVSREEGGRWMRASRPED
jgi:hypothetical protein